MTLKQVRARFRNGVLEPLDDLGLSEDEEVLVTITGLSVRRATDPEGLPKSAGAWSGQFDDYQQLIRDIYQARLDGSRESPKL